MTASSAAAGNRERVLDAAERLAVQYGMSKLRVGQVAEDAGVSRQTVYNQFTDKFGLAKALGVRLTHRLLDGFEPHLAQYPSLPEALGAGIAYILQTAPNEPLVALALASKTDDDLLMLLTTDAGAIIEAAHQRMRVMAAGAWPEIDPRVVKLGIDLSARLTISHIVCPTEPIEVSARKVVAMMRALIVAGPGAR